MATTSTFTPAKTNHVLHGVLTLLTFGGWAGVWLVAAVTNQNKYVRSETISG